MKLSIPMKLFAGAVLSLLASSPLAFADAPNYRLPEGVELRPEACFTTELVATPEGLGWSEWKSETKEERFQSATWNVEADGYTLKQSENFVSHTHFTDERLEDGYVRRFETAETWKKVGGAWNKEVTQTEVMLRNREGIPQRRIERRGSVSLYWDVTLTFDENESSLQRVLKNPSALSTDQRKIGSRVETCRRSMFNK